MQNQESNHQPSGFSKILKERGYYILLALCVLAVGISGYVFVSSAVRQNQASQETLSVPVTAQDPEKDTKPSDTKKPTAAATAPTEPSASASALRRKRQRTHRLPSSLRPRWRRSAAR